MAVRRGLVRVAWLLVLLAAVIGWRVYRKLPPYTQGLHDVVGELPVAEASGAPGRTEGPRVAGCPIFPADNVWNMPIDGLAKDQRAAAYAESIGLAKKMHPDFGSSLSSGMPFSEIPKGTKRVGVKFENADESDLGNYPIPPNAPIEGGGTAEGDNHVLLIDGQRCLLYELFGAKPKGDGDWTAGSGIKMDLTDNALRADGKTSADAAGLPIFPGLVRYEEVEAGHIDHALRFTVPHTQAAYVWPARHKASHSTDLNLPPLGLRFRLRADFDVSKYSKTNQVILLALKKYGMFLADNGGAMFLSGVSDKRWDDSDLHKLGGVTAEDFEAVDESGWQMMADSGRVDPVALKR